MTSEPNENPDEELVAQAIAAGDGDLRAFDQLVERHKGRILANCRYLTRSSEDSEDLAQEVFLKAFFALPRFEGRSAFKTWVHRIKINHCLNYLAKKKGKEFIDIEEPGLAQHESMSVSAEAQIRAEAASDRERIAWVLDNMTETLRVPLIMRDADGFSYQEISEHLGVGLSAVKMRIKRGREEFRQSWTEAFGDRSDDSPIHQ